MNGEQGMDDSMLGTDPKLLHALLESSDSLIVLSELNGTIVFVEGDCEAVLGYPKSSILGQQFPNIIHTEDVEKISTMWDTVTKRQKPFNSFEYRVVDSGGQIRWIAHSAKPQSVAGYPQYVQHTMHSITKQKTSELNLQQLNQFNELILNASPNIVYVYDIAEKCNVYSNTRIEDQLGYTRQEAKKMGDALISQLMHPDDFTTYLEETLPRYQTLADDQFLVHSYRMRHKSGHWVWLIAKEAVFLRDNSGTVKQIFGLIIDVTQQRRHEAHMKSVQKALKESENRYRLLFENMDSACALHEIVTNEHGSPIDYRFLEVNRSFEQTIGMKREDIVGRLVTEVLPGIETDPADWIGKYGRVALEGVSHRFIQFSDPLKRWFAIVAYAPIHGQFATISLDITDQKNIELRLQEAEKMRAIGLLAGGIAHDFNNQLAGIVGYADLLAESSLPGSETAMYAERILLSTQRATDLTTQLLAFARKGKYLSVSTNLQDIVLETVNILQHTIDRRIHIIQEFESGDSRVIGDPSQLQNAVMNLCLNARDAMVDGGEMRIAIRRQHLTPLDCKVLPFDLNPGDFVEVSVSDTGCGMDETVQSKMFEPFFTTKGLDQGTGMGLAAVYGTIKNHGGAIDVYSRVNHGTTIRMILPADTSMPKPAQESKPMVISSGSARVLLVDDEPLVVDTCSEMLKRLGYSVDVCNNGFDALTFFEARYQSIDVVILDMVMPEMDGRETQLKMREIKPDIRILMSSGGSLDGVASEMLEEGINGFIQKPFRMPELSSKLAELTP